MFYYNYDTRKCILLNEITEAEKTDTSVCSSEQYDLDLYDVYVGILSGDGTRTIVKATKMIKNDEVIIRTVNDVKSQNLGVAETVRDVVGSEATANEVLEAMVRSTQNTFLAEIADGKRTSTEIVDCEALISPWAKEGANGDGTHAVNEVVTHAGQVWRCCQAHNTNNNPDVEPGKNPAIWVPYHTSNVNKAKPFIQPTMAEDAYSKGEVCIWTDDVVYRSLIDANVYSPTDYPAGWEVVEND